MQDNLRDELTARWVAVATNPDLAWMQVDEAFRFLGPYPSESDEGFPFTNYPPADEFAAPVYPQHLVCKCGCDTFRIHSPESFNTVATCTACGKSGCIAEG